MRYILAAFALLFSASFAFAQAVPRVVFPSYTVPPVTTIGPLTANAANAASFSFGAASNGSIFANAPANMPRSGGGIHPIDVGGVVGKPSVGRALGRFLTRGVPLISTAAALYDLGEDLGFTLGPNNELLKDGPATTGWTARANPDGSPRVFSDPVAAGNDWVAGAPNYAGYIFESMGTLFNGVQNMYYCAVNPNGSWGNCIITSATEVAGEPPTASVDDVETAVTNSPSALAPAIAALLPDLLANGESVDVEPQSITGPASDTVSDTTVQDFPEPGQATRDIVRNGYDYGPNTVTTTRTTRRIVTAPNGDVISDITSSPEPAPAPSPDPSPDPSPGPSPEPFVMPCGVAGTPPCAVDIDETGTMQTVTIADAVAAALAEATANREAISGGGVLSGGFESFRSLFLLPPVAQCEPFPMPDVMGVPVPPIDACGVVNGVRSVMGVLWSVVALWIALGWVREVF